MLYGRRVNGFFHYNKTAAFKSVHICYKTVIQRLGFFAEPCPYFFCNIVHRLFSVDTKPYEITLTLKVNSCNFRLFCDFLKKPIENAFVFNKYRYLSAAAPFVGNSVAVNRDKVKIIRFLLLIHFSSSFRI